MKKRLFALVLLLLLLAGCTAAPEADYMAPVRAYCLALQNNDFSQLQQAMPAAVLSSNGLDAGELDELRAPFLTHTADSITIRADAVKTTDFTPKERAALQAYLFDEYVCKLDIDAAKLLKLHLRFGGDMEGELTLPTVVYRANSRWYVEFSRRPPRSKNNRNALRRISGERQTVKKPIQPKVSEGRIV